MALFGKWLLLLLLSFTSSESPHPLTCSSIDEVDPNVVETTIDFGEFLGGQQTVPVYVQPDVTTFYKHQDLPASTPVVPKHNGFSAKFINLSNEQLKLYWDPRDGGNLVPMWNAPPFSCGGTASFPTHSFVFTKLGDSTQVIQRFTVKDYPNNVYVYDPYTVGNDHDATLRNIAHLNENELELYKILRRTVLFNEHYFNVTGRSYLVNYHRAPSKHFMWPADYFGQEHWVVTKETHFQELPPEDKLGRVTEFGSARVLKESDPRILADYRDPGVFNMTLKVISCAPRALEIQNFLSEVEVRHIMQLAAGIDLKLSSVGAESENNLREEAEKKNRGRTRTSFNSWVPREKSPVVDAVYRRAADLMRMDEALYRKRSPDEIPDWPSKGSIAEHLQLVHYDLTQEYTAHHDFGFSNANDPMQSQRYATLLLYLNEGMEGGETAFPRWVNAESFQELKITPKVGKAILFYSQLPDGNMDDFSHHAAKPIIKGEKWLINLWVSDPTFRKG